MTKNIVVVLNGDSRVLGPFETVKEAMQQARAYYETEDALEHADENADFYLSRLFPTAEEAVISNL